MKSTSLTTAYKKEKDELGLSVQKTYFVKLEAGSIYMEDGFNLRDIDNDHVVAIAKAYRAGKYVPAIVVKPTPEGLKIVDGHHRYLAAFEADIQAIEVKNFVGDEADEVAFMITSSQGRNLTPVERAKGYQRLQAQGLTQKEIVERTGRSASDVKNHLTLLTASKKVIDAVQSGKAGFAAVVEELNRSGFDGQKKIEQQVDSGTKVTRATLAKWNLKKANMLMEILCAHEHELPEMGDDFKELMELYRS